MSTKLDLIDTFVRKFTVIYSSSFTSTDGSATIYRIVRESDGAQGGFVQSSANLSNKGTCWIDSNAEVYDSALVTDAAVVTDNARVHGNALIAGNALVNTFSEIYGNAIVTAEAVVICSPGSFIKDNAKIYGSAVLSGAPAIYGNAEIYGTADVVSTVCAGDCKINEGVPGAQYLTGDFTRD